MKGKMSTNMKQWLLAAVMPVVLPAMGQTVSYTILSDQPRQTIDHFGASDAWSMQQVGLWPDSVRYQVADWLFSTHCDSTGQPLGIGLSLWRFNLGAGSSEQGQASHINPDTRTECFLQADGSYDWSRQAGQVAFMKMAKERGVPFLLAFLNSPPVFFTHNGLATNTGRDGTFNLRPECYDSFAIFMAEAVAGLEREHGLHIDYLSPVNEPDGHWNWQGPKQEGTPATNRELARIARLAGQELDRRGLNTQVTIGESSDLRCLLGIYQTSWQRGNTIATLFCPDSTETYLGQATHVPRLLLAHSYWTNTPVDSMKRIRQRLHHELSALDVDYWQSELCIMGNDEEIGGGGGYDFTMKTALYVARVIHHDLVYAHAKSWSWWRACGGNYKDGLIRIYNHRQQARDSRLLWAFGNYSRFVRPGAVRYDMQRTPTADEDPYGLMLSAYRNNDGSWVCVAINYSHDPQNIRLLLSGNNDDSPWVAYRTSDAEGETLRPAGTLHTTQTATLPPRSITTFVKKK